MGKRVADMTPEARERARAYHRAWRAIPENREAHKQRLREARVARTPAQIEQERERKAAKWRAVPPETRARLQQDRKDREQASPQLLRERRARVTELQRERRAALGAEARSLAREGLNPEAYRTRERDRYLRKTYKISLGDEQRMRAKQGGLCAICREGPAEAVDHCHTFGHVRALLCRECNLGLGSYCDRPDLLRAAAEYLERHAPEK